MALKGVNSEYDLMLITRNGIIIRCDVNKISIIGRNTQGVKLIRLDDDDSVIDVALCEKGDEPEDGSIVIANPEVATTEEVSLSSGDADSEEGDATPQVDDLE